MFTVKLLDLRDVCVYAADAFLLQEIQRADETETEGDERSCSNSQC